MRSTRHDRLILVMGHLGHREVLIEVDTGKSRTTVDPALVQELGLAKGRNGVSLPDLRIGSRVFPVEAAKEVRLGQIDPGLAVPIEVGIGSDVLSRAVLTVDYAKGKMILLPARS